VSGNHTPTPWAIGRYGDVLSPVDGDYIKAKGFALTGAEEAVANSAFIVTAVNSYASSQAEIERLRTALKPFAMIAEMEHRAEVGASVMVNVERCRDARAALSGSKE
jgi:hypothetical protein